MLIRRKGSFLNERMGGEGVLYGGRGNENRGGKLERGKLVEAFERR